MSNNEPKCTLSKSINGGCAGTSTKDMCANCKDRANWAMADSTLPIPITEGEKDLLHHLIDEELLMAMQYYHRQQSGAATPSKQASQLLKPTNSEQISSKQVEQLAEEDISHLAGRPISEIYLHGVIAGQKERIKQLKECNNTHIALIEERIKDIGAEIAIKSQIMQDIRNSNNKELHINIIELQHTYEVLTDLLTKFKGE